MIWCTNDPNVHIDTFHNHCSFIWRCFFPLSILKTKANPNFSVKLAERSNHSFLLSIWWTHFPNIFTLSYVIIECVELNWLCKYMKKVRSSQVVILALNWVKTQFFYVGIVKTISLKFHGNIYFPWQKPQQLLSAEANFKCCK